MIENPAKQRVLVLEDETNIRQLLTLILQSIGCEVAAAATVQVALEQLALCRPDLIVTDKKLNGQDGGFRLIDEARRLYPDAPVPAILLSGSTTALRRLEEQAAQYEKVQFMGKPFCLNDLTKQVKSMLGPEGESG